MAKIRVLVVDDAVVVRRIVTDVLTADPAIEVAGTAAHGRIALAKIPQVNPDLVTLDVEMPEMDGLTTLREIRKLYPKLPVIMFSTLTERGATATLDALAAGATDYVTKPANVGSVQIAMNRIRDELIPKIKHLCGGAIATPAPHIPRLIVPARPAPLVRPAVEAVVIGVSTGGPNALADVIPLLPANLPVPVLIVQHMPPVFTKLLAARLQQKAPFEVKEAVHGEPVRPGVVYLAPGDWHMAISKTPIATTIQLNQGTPENSCRPAVDVLFRSAAAAYGAATLAVVMTGMGADGLRGCEAVRDVHGQVFVQDEASSVVWGMPGFVSRAGLADKVVPLNRIAQEITARLSAARRTVYTTPGEHRAAS